MALLPSGSTLIGHQFATAPSGVTYRHVSGDQWEIVTTKTDLDLKENSSNKQNSLAIDGTGVKYPTVDAVKTDLDLKAPTTGGTGYIQNQTALSQPSSFHISGTARIGDLNTGVGKVTVSGNYTEMNKHSFDDYSVINSTTVDNLGYGVFDVSTEITGTTNNDHFISYQARPTYSGSGTLGGIASTPLSNNKFLGGFLYSPTHNGTGLVYENSGITLADVNGTGPVQRSYGLYIRNINKGSALNYSIWTNQGRVRFGDDVITTGSITTPAVIATEITMTRDDNFMGGMFSLVGKNSGSDEKLYTYHPTGIKIGLALNNVNNTSDVNKPVSTAQQTALDLKAPLASPALTGTPTAPTATVGTNTTQLATTAFVQAAQMWNVVSSELKPISTTNGVNITNSSSSRSLYVENTVGGGGAYIKSGSGTTATFISNGTSNPVIVANTSGSNKFLELYSSALKIEILNDGTINQYSGSGVQNSLFSGIIQAESSTHFAYIDGNLGSVAFGLVGSNAIISGDNLTAQRAFQMPNAAGTLGLAPLESAATTTQTSASLNSAYPSVIAGQVVIAPSVGTGMGYIKKANGNWMSFVGSNI